MESAISGTNLPHIFEYDDLRDWIDLADRLGELRRVAGANCEEEIGMAAEIVSHDENAPAVLFDEIPGSPSGFRVLTNIFGGKRMRLTLGFPEHLTKAELSEAYFDSCVNKLEPISSEKVTDGPVLENVLTGDDIDLDLFPAPKWHEQDGGRYIGTGCFNVSRHPETGWINLGTYRIMVRDKKTVAYNAAPGKHGRLHHELWAAKNKPMPVAMVVGGDPLMFMMGGTEHPAGVSEYDVVGGLRGRAVKVVEGPTTGLPIPANAEIVIEGFVHPSSVVSEGPFGDWTGTYTESGRQRPLVEVTSICHRNSPVLLGMPPQMPPDEYSRYNAVLRSAMMKKNLTDAGVPDVSSVWCHEVGGARMLVGVSIKQRYPGHSKQAGHAAASCLLGAYACKWFVVVDDDIDVSNLDELLWAFLFLADPVEDIDFFKGGWTSPADPLLTAENRAVGDLRNNRAIVDACRPFHMRKSFLPINKPSAEQRARAREKYSWLLD
tara:strand:- start:321 stop:1793 length:1473 start_codon:yes stop_codon:yes gene_type:complete